MKTKIIFLVILMLAFFGCQKDSSVIELQNEKVLKNFPERPTLNVGEKTDLLKLKSATIVSDMNTLTAEDLVNALVAPGPSAPIVSNVVYSGAAGAAGTFDADDVFGLGSGIVLSSGNIQYIQGPNVSDAAGANNGLPGDADLDGLIPGYSTHDATILEFDFECDYLQYISFQYVFASDEYNEYVGSSFNDVFGFFVNGVNIALIPETTIPVAVNNLNCGNPYGSADNYCALFNNNDLNDGGGSLDTEADGFTVVLTATTPVNPGLNHIKLAIADAGDWILDSHVLIKGESFVCAPPVLPVLFDVIPDPLNRENKGVTPMVIFGAADFDVNLINVETLLIEGIAPVRWQFTDVNYDGFMDLTLKFNTPELMTITTIADAEVGDEVVVTITGELSDGTPIVGEDVVRIVK